MIPEPGAQIAGHRLEALVGRGGGGVVYRARHLRLDRTVAIKLLAPALAADSDFRRRFEREARLAAALEHPHIVPVYDADEADGLLYLAMRFVEGPDLATLIRTEGPLSLQRTCAVLGQVADALDTAHRAGLVHQDVKPANILLHARAVPGRPEHAYLSDFGLSHRLDGPSVTSGLVAGTLAYMAPERFSAAAPESAADVYALGCTAYACLSGAPPFSGENPGAVMAAHLYEAPPLLRDRGFGYPPAVDRVLARATAKSPADRFPTCAAFIGALRGAVAPEPAHPPLPFPGGPTRVPGPAPAAPPRRGRLIAAGIAGTAVLAALAIVIAVTVSAARPGAGPLATATQLADDIDAVAVDGQGNVYIATLEDDRVQRVTPEGVISTVAGGVGEGFSGDGGPAVAARLKSPRGLTVDAAGNLYIADTGNHRVRRVDPTGIITTIGGTGSIRSRGDGGPASLAEFRGPIDVTVDGTGNLYVLEAEGARVRRIDPNGVIKTVAGTGTQGDSGDGGPATEAQLDFAYSLAVDGSGAIYIADNSAGRVRRVDPDGTISTVAGTGEPGFAADGAAATASAITPVAIAVDGAGTLYISDGPRVRAVDASGIVTTVAGTGARGAPGVGRPARETEFASVQALAAAPDGALYLGDDHSHRLVRVGPDGIVGAVAGTGPDYPGDGGAATDAFLRTPTATVVGPEGRTYFADSGNHRIRRIDPDGTISTVAGTGDAGFAGDGGPATAAQLNNPLGLVIGPDGTLYISDTANERIRRVAPDGTISTIAGTGRQELSRDGIPALDAALAGPVGLEIDGDGGLLVAEAVAGRVRRIDAAGTIGTVAGTGEDGSTGDGGPASAARLTFPYALHRSAEGTLFVTDSRSNVVRRIGPDGIISTVAGTGTAGFSGDGGPATAATLADPREVTTDEAGNLYIADSGNRRVRRVDPAGVITTVAGSGRDGQSPDGPAASYRFGGPSGLALDRAGNLVIADPDLARLLRLDPAGTVTTVGGQPF